MFPHQTTTIILRATSPHSLPNSSILRRHFCLWSMKKDPDLESALSRNRRWIINNQIKNIILRYPNNEIPIETLQKKFKTLDLQGKALNWISKYPSCFELHQRRIRLTKRMINLVHQEQTIKDSLDAVFAQRLAKLLMLSVNNTLNVIKINEIKNSLGFPDDYLIRIVPRYPDLFRIVNESGRRSSMAIELIHWNPSFAVSEVEASALRNGVDPNFKCCLPSSWVKSMEKFREFESVPYVSPYLDPRVLVDGSREMEKRNVGLVHELLSLTLWKKVSIMKLGHFKREFFLPDKLNVLLLKHPGIFYVSNKYRIYTVLLREGYVGSQLLEKDPLVVVKEKFGEIMQEGLHEYNQRRRLVNIEKKRNKGVPLSRVDEDEMKGRRRRRRSGEVSDEYDDDVVDGGNGNKLGGLLDPEERKRFYKVLFEDDGSFSSDPETSMRLVQHEGGPCGVLATIQAFVLKYIIFFSNELSRIPQNRGLGVSSKSHSVPSYNISSLTEDVKVRALVRSMGEILFSCGSNKRAVIATLSIPGNDIQRLEGISEDEVVASSLKALSIESSFDLLKVLIVETHTSEATAFQRFEAIIPLFQSRMGALLFLISALLSRGLDSVQNDRDDPSLPLVTAPFGHASQEIVNLLLCGQAVANVFDGRMDLGGGMFLKGISRNVEVGFLTLLESLNFCKVGQFLKTPKWPIWVVGSESHYTVLFALDPTVQNENELEGRETQIRKAFDAQDQSGGGGFISVEGFHQVIRETNIKLPQEKLDNLCSAGFIVWSEFWQVILDLYQNLGGLKDSSGLMGKKVFDLFHFNGIAKSDLNGSQISFGGETPLRRPRLTKLSVSVTPRWTPEEFMADVQGPSASGTSDSAGKDIEVSKPEPVQHAPLVDCVRHAGHVLSATGRVILLV